MATREGLKEIATYADAVGPDKIYIIPRNSDSSLSTGTNFLKDAHALGLEVHAYTFCSENIYLPIEFQTNDTSEEAIGDLKGEIEAYFAAGIDGLFVDQPDVAAQIKKTMHKLD